MSEAGIKKFMRDVPLPFCPGCGDLTVMSSFLRAVQELGYNSLRKFVFCSGIGCAAWIPSPHFIADTIHTTHGRSIPVATGIQLVRPDLKVVVFGGDGDLTGIGLSHLIHAARRNVDLTVIMVNNMIYGMTGGQVAPTTPIKMKTTTTPYGNIEQPIDTTRLVVAAGASYAARWTTAQADKLREAMKKGLRTKGFAFVEAVSHCPTAFGRRVGLKTIVNILDWFKENSISLEYAEKMTEKDLEGKIIVGEFVHRELPTFTENIYALIKEAQKSAEKG